MRILGRHFTSCELLAFAMVYLFGNYTVVRMQQKWREQELDAKASHTEHVRARQIHQEALKSRNEQTKEDGRLTDDLHLEGDLMYRDKPDQPSARFLPVVRDDVRPPEQQDELVPDVNEETVTEIKLETKPAVTGRFDTYPSDQQLSIYDQEKVEREEMRREKLGDPTQAGYKTILFWNKFFHSDDFRFGIGHAPFIEHKCPVHQCITTTDKKQLSRAHMVMFHGPLVDNFPPPKRPRNQIYGYVQQEPHYGLSVESLPKYNGHMNLTITHRRDSDIWIPYTRVLYDPERSTKIPVKTNPKDKPRSVVWVVSHCSTPGKREWYVQELQKYIDIDVYGDCGDMQCSKDDTWYCYEKFEKEYSFYMALENNYCTDYISEKVFRPLNYKIVPIVFGGGNYSHFTPPHSVIDIMDYPHPKELARYLHFLIDNTKAYNRYFAWKTKGYELDTSRKAIMGDAFCRICEILHDPNFVYKDYKNLKGWWTHNICDSYAIPRLRRKAKW